jgi:tetratricopeptide (TPR) repeat protein
MLGAEGKFVSTYRCTRFKGLLAIAFLTFLATAAAQDQSASQIENLNEQVQDLIQHLRVQEALPLAERALEGARKLRLPKEKNEVLLMSSINLAMIETVRGNFDRAEELYSEWLPILSKAGPSSLYEMVSALEAYTRTYALFFRGKVAEAKLLAEQTLTTIRELSQSPGLINSMLVPSLHLLAEIDAALKQYEDAEKLWIEEVAVLRKAPLQAMDPDAVKLFAADAQAEVLYQKGNVLAAIALAKSNLRNADSLPPSASKASVMADSLITLADLFERLGRYDDADQLFIKALSLLKNLPDKPLAIVTIQESQIHAQVLFKNGKLAEAVSLAEESLRNSRLIADEGLVTTCLHTLALMYEGAGRYKDAENRLSEELPLLRKQLGEHPNVAVVLGALGAVYAYEGRYNEAERSYNDALEMWKKFQLEERPDRAEMLANMGFLYHSKGRLRDAESRYEEALAMWAKLGIGEHFALAWCLNNLAVLYAAQSRFQDAERLFDKAQAMLDKMGYKNHPIVALLMSSRARIYQIQGRGERAEPLYLDSLKMFDTLGIKEHPYRASCLNNLAVLYQEQQKYEEAERYYVEALAIWNNLLPSEDPESAAVLSNLASLYAEQRQYTKAKPLYLQAVAIWQKRLPEDHPTVANGLNNLAFFYFQQRQYREAQPLFRQALKIWRASLPHDDLLLAGGLQNLALVLWALQSSSQGSLDEVSQLLRESAEIRIAVLGRELKPGVEIAAVQDNLIRVSRFEGVSADIALSFAVRPQGLINNAEAAKTALLEEWVQKGRAQEEARRQSRQSQALSVDEAKLRLPQSAALLEFAAYHDLKPEMTKQEALDSDRRYAACILRWDSDPLCMDLGKAEDIERATEEFFQFARSPELKPLLSPNVSRLWPTFSPILERLKGVERLFVAEDKTLNMLPLQALKTQQAGVESWMDRFEITYLNSGRDLLWRAKEQAATGAAVVAGLNGYGTPRAAISAGDGACPQRISDFPSLKFPEEMAQLAAKTLGVTPLLSLETTKERLRQAVAAGPAPRALVVAVHGCVRQKSNGQENELALVMSDGAGGWNYLSSTDLAQWPLQGSALYIMACWAGSPVGRIVGNLRQAATLSGARYLVAPLWEVPEPAVKEFLRLLLGQQQRLSPAAALREAQKSMRKDPKYYYRYYWAGFTINGVGAAQTPTESVKVHQPKPELPNAVTSRDIEQQSKVNLRGANADCGDVRSLTIDKNRHEGFYLGSRFGNGSAEFIHLSNMQRNEETVTVERYSENGCLLERFEKTIPAGGKAKVALGYSVQESCRQFSWIRIVSGKGITVSNTQRVVRGNALVEVERGTPSPRGSAGHFFNRWVLSLGKRPDLAYFLNLSEHPVKVGICQSDRRDFFCGALDHTVAPMEEVGFPVDQIREEFAVIQSTPGASVAQTIRIVEGDERPFGVKTKIEPVPPEVANMPRHFEKVAPVDANRQKKINAFRTEGALFYESGQYGRSVDAYQNAVELDRDNPELLQEFYQACDAKDPRPEIFKLTRAPKNNTARSRELSKSAAPPAQTAPSPHVPQPQDWVGDWESAAPATWDTNCYVFSSKKPSTAKENLRFQIISVDASGQVKAAFSQHQVTSSWTGEATATQLSLRPPPIAKGTLLPDLTKLAEQSGDLELRRDGESYSAVLSYKRKGRDTVLAIPFTCMENGSFTGPIRRSNLVSVDSSQATPEPSEVTTGLSMRAPAEPWTRDQIMRMMKGDIPPDRVLALAFESRINFHLTVDEENELRRVGADDSLIAALWGLAPPEPRPSSLPQTGELTDSLKLIESGQTLPNAGASDRPPIAPPARPTAEQAAPAAEQQVDVAPFGVVHDHNFFVDSLLKSFIFIVDDDSCRGWMGIRGDTVWFRSDNKPKHSFSTSTSQIREAVREGLSGIITLHLRNGKKYKFFTDAENAQKFVSRIQGVSK